MQKSPSLPSQKTTGLQRLDRLPHFGQPGADSSFMSGDTNLHMSDFTQGIAANSAVSALIALEGDDTTT